jgi:hypothetical protein
MSETGNEVLTAQIQGYQQLNSEEHKNILEKIESFIIEQKKINENNEKRLVVLEHWQISFMAKIGVYSAIAIVFGTAIGTVVWSIVQKMFFR